MADSEKINYWIELSEYDLATAKAMLKTNRYLYVGFMCHQSIQPKEAVSNVMIQIKNL